MAHLRIGEYYQSAGGDNARALQHFARAHALRERVTDRERYVIDAAYFTAREQYAQARESLRVLVDLYPEDPEFRFQLALVHYSLGDLARAIETLRELLDRDPRSTRGRGSLVLFLARNNEADAAIAAFDEATQQGIDAPYLLWGLGLARLGRGDVDAARTAFERLRDSGGFYEGLGRLHLARLALYEGRLDEASEALVENIEAERAAGRTAGELLGRYLLARTHLLAGRPQAARRQAQAMLTAGEALKAEDLRQAGLVFAWAGATTEARVALERLDVLRGDSPGGYAQFCWLALGGELALAEGNAVAATTAFEQASAAQPSYESRHGLARALRGTDERRSLAEWEHVARARGEILQDGFPLDWAVAQRQIARLSRQAGDRDRACAAYGAVEDELRRATWTAWLEEARQEWTQFGCATTPGAGQGRDRRSR
jgi:tetratricopeptide (TPR) repeat protein